MSFDRIKDTGSGQLEFRLYIEGLQETFVSSEALASGLSLSSGHVAVNGLQRDGIGFEESPALAQAEVEASGMTVQIVDRQTDDRVTTAFASQPTVYTWLTADLTASATTVSVKSTAGMTAGDTIHVGTEAILIGTVASTTSLTGCSRGYRGTIAQAHYTSDGKRLGFTEVTLHRFRSLERRRVQLIAYGQDDLSGTTIWRGVCLTDARLEADGATWSLTLDPVTALMDADLGGDLDGEPKKPRGIYIPASAAIHIEIAELGGAAASVGAALSAGTEQDIYVAGFYASNTELCDEINAQIDLSSWTGTPSLEAVPDADFDWFFAYRPDSTDPRFPSVRVEGDTEGTLWAYESLVDMDGRRKGRVAAGTDYRIVFLDGNRGVPRGWFGVGSRTGTDMVPSGTFLSDGTTEVTSANFPDYRIYLDDSFALDSDLSAIEIKQPNTEETRVLRVTAVDTTNSHVTTSPLVMVDAEIKRYHPGSQLEIYYSRHYATGDLYDFLLQVTTDAPTYANLGAVPFLTTSDIDLTEIQAVVASRATKDFQNNRKYVAFKSVELREMFAHENRLIGCFPRMTSDAKIGMTTLRLASPTEASVASINEDAILVGNGYPGWERGKEGHVNTVRVKTGYSAREDDHLGDEYVVRDQTAFARHKKTFELEIAPYSEYAGAFSSTTAVDVGEEVLGVFGQPYAIVSVEVPLTLFDVLCGDTVSFTCSTLPNPTTGRRGITDQPAIVTSRRWDLDQGRGQFTLLVTFAEVAGYTPSVYVSSETNTSGNTWELVVSTNDPLGNALFEAGDVLSDHFVAGMQVEVERWDHSTTSAVTGEVDSVDDATNTITVTFGSTWTPSTFDWLLGYTSGITVGITSDQKEYAWWGGTDGKVSFSGDEQSAGTFGP